MSGLALTARTINPDCQTCPPQEWRIATEIVNDAALGHNGCDLSELNPNNPGADLADYKLVIEDAETGAGTPFALRDVKNITFAFTALLGKLTESL